MRLSRLTIIFGAWAWAAFALFAAQAWAQKLAADAELHAKPSARSETLAVLAAGWEVTVEASRDDGWSKISAGEWRGWVQTTKLAPDNPHCDLGYPYSGSARYFEGLTALRTSEPLGFLLGYHVARPC